MKIYSIVTEIAVM